jgi:DNA-binding MarR family transcriptional regulator
LTVNLLDSTLRQITDLAQRTGDQPAIPALLRTARGCYGNAIREGLARAGFDDVPRNGAFVLAAVGNYGAPFADAVAGLGVSKQAASQLVDTLVLRGYVERNPDPTDRRRLNVTLTERGQAAATTIRTAVVSIDQLLATKLSGDDISALRRGLTALSEIGRESA